MLTKIFKNRIACLDVYGNGTTTWQHAWSDDAIPSRFCDASAFCCQGKAGVTFTAYWPFRAAITIGVSLGPSLSLFTRAWVLVFPLHTDAFVFADINEGDVFPGLSAVQHLKLFFHGMGICKEIGATSSLRPEKEAEQRFEFGVEMQSGPILWMR